MKKITLAGGCFWGIEAYFKRIKGVEYTEVGYTGGILTNPNYQEVCSGETGHVEAVIIKFNEEIISVNKILEHFFRIIEPTSLNKQGNDVGTQYATAIFYSTEVDRELIEKFILDEQKKYTDKIVVKVEKEKVFYSAEDYHQAYLEKNPNGYCHINLNLIKDFEVQKPV